MNFLIVLIIFLNRCLADLCGGISYKRDFLPKSIDASTVEAWTPIKEPANGEELCCSDPCKQTWRLGGGWGRIPKT